MFLDEDDIDKKMGNSVFFKLQNDGVGEKRAPIFDLSSIPGIKGPTLLFKTGNCQWVINFA